MAKKFIPGLQLNRMFYQEVIKPLMKKHFPELKYAAGVVGNGSDVLGFDNETSMDHDWGPHLHLFFSEADYIAYKEKVDSVLRQHLPYTFKGYSTNFEQTKTYLVHRPKVISEGPVNHMFRFWTIRSFFYHYLAFDPYKKPSQKDWLLFPQQALIEVTAGKVYHDDLGFEKIRQKFTYYPDAVWRYIYTIQWEKISQEEAFMGRTGEIGDELGSNIIASDLVRTLMQLCFLIEKHYIPYVKWFGSSFGKLKAAKKLEPILIKVVHSNTWEEREKYLGDAYEIVAKMHNRLELSVPIPTRLTSYYGREFKVLDAYRIYRELEKKFLSRKYKKLMYKIGAIDQFFGHTKPNLMNYVYMAFRNVIK